MPSPASYHEIWGGPKVLVHTRTISVGNMYRLRYGKSALYGVTYTSVCQTRVFAENIYFYLYWYSRWRQRHSSSPPLSFCQSEGLVKWDLVNLHFHVNPETFSALRPHTCKVPSTNKNRCKIKMKTLVWHGIVLPVEPLCMLTSIELKCK